MYNCTHVSSEFDVEVAKSQEEKPPANVQEFNQEKCKTKDSPDYELASDKKDIKSTSTLAQVSVHYMVRGKSAHSVNENDPEKEKKMGSERD